MLKRYNSDISVDSRYHKNIYSMTRGRSPGLRLPWSQVNGEKVAPLTVEYTFAHSRIEYIF